VKATVPEDKLLVFKVTEGWGPLCDFVIGTDSDDNFTDEELKVVQGNCDKFLNEPEKYPFPEPTHDLRETYEQMGWFVL